MKYRTKVDRPVEDGPDVRAAIDDLVELMERTPPEDRRRVLRKYFEGGTEDDEDEAR